MPAVGRRDDGMTGAADIVLRGGNVWTGAVHAGPLAVAVQGGSIVFVGGDEDLRELVGRHTRVIDLAGRTVLPGFQDAHVHPPWGGLYATQCELHGVDPGEYSSTIVRYAAEHPDATWVRGGGWSMAAFPGGTPTRRALDTLVPDRPAYLTNRDDHGAWVNTRALELAGLTRDTPDPPDGRIEREQDGQPSGTLHEGAMDLVERLLPEPTPAEWLEAIRGAQTYLHSLGITAWQDAIVTPETLAAYRTLAEREELTARVVGALWWDRHRGEEQVEELLELRRRGTVNRLRCGSVKIMLDGVCENFTASMLESYLGDGGRPTGNRGMPMLDPSALRRAVVRLDREGFQVHVHAIGDRAIREALDAFEAARERNGPGDGRHHIAHIQVVHPRDVPRFSALGVVANAQPFWACLEEYQRDLTIPFIGPERSSWQYPFASLVRSGARLAFGSDWTVSTPNPLLQIEVAMTRVSPEDRSAEPFLPHERLDLSTSLRAFTAGSAFVNHLDHMTGTLEPGKAADLVVLDRDLFAPDAAPVGDARVLLTMVGGESVYTDSGLA